MRKVRFLVVLLVLSMLFSACGSAGTPVGAISTENVDESTEVDYLGNVTTAPENTESTETVENTEDIIEFPSDESTEVNSEVDNTEDSSESNNSESEVIVDSSESNTSESTTPNTSESEVIVDNNNSESTNTPSSGEHVNWNGPGTTLPNLSVSIPTLGAFNSPALGDSANTFIGDDSSTEGHDAMQKLYDTADAIHDACVNQGIMPWDSAGFLVGDNAISWSFTTFSSMNSLELWRDPSSNIYTLEVNIRLTPGHNVLNGTDLSLYSNDILLYMCSVVSSTPDTLYANIYQDIEGEVCISDSSWTTVGDCKVKFDLNNSYNNHYVYLIKAGE